MRLFLRLRLGEMDSLLFDLIARRALEGRPTSIPGFVAPRFSSQGTMSPASVIVWKLRSIFVSLIGKMAVRCLVNRGTPLPPRSIGSWC